MLKWVSTHRMAGLGFAVSAAYWPGMLSAAYVPRWAVIAVGIPLVSRLDPATVPESIRWLLAWILALAALVTAYASPDQMAGWLELFFGLLIVITFTAACALDGLDDLMSGIGAGLALSSALAAAQYFDLWSPIVQGSNPSGLFYSSEVLAEFAAIVFVWALVRWRPWMMAVSIVPLVLCHSRVALFAIACGAVYALWPRRSIWRLALMIALVVMGISLIVGMGVGKAGSAEHRIVLWGASALTILAHPFGSGLGWAQAAFPMESYVHSDALQAIAELGLGAIVLLAIPVLGFARGGGNAGERAAFVAVVVECLISFPLHMPATAFLSAMLAGVIIGTGHRLRARTSVGRVEDVDGVQWQVPANCDAFSISGHGGDVVSFRSVFACDAQAYTLTSFGGHIDDTTWAITLPLKAA